MPLSLPSCAGRQRWLEPDPRRHATDDGGVPRFHWKHTQQAALQSLYLFELSPGCLHFRRTRVPGQQGHFLYICLELRSIQGFVVLNFPHVSLHYQAQITSYSTLWRAKHRAMALLVSRPCTVAFTELGSGFGLHEECEVFTLCMMLQDIFISEELGPSAWLSKPSKLHVSWTSLSGDDHHPPHIDQDQSQQGTESDSPTASSSIENISDPDMGLWPEDLDIQAVFGDASPNEIEAVGMGVASLTTASASASSALVDMNSAAVAQHANIQNRSQHDQNAQKQETVEIDP